MGRRFSPGRLPGGPSRRGSYASVTPAPSWRDGLRAYLATWRTEDELRAWANGRLSWRDEVLTQLGEWLEAGEVQHEGGKWKAVEA